MTTRESWKSSLGFVLASVGSAIGLANIWRFPYIVGANGGAAFVFVYLISIFLIGFPVFVSEILLGRRTHKNPKTAFSEVGKGRLWSGLGMLAVVTAFVMSSFYSVVAGWILGYLIEAFRGGLVNFNDVGETQARFSSLISNPWWSVCFHFGFIVLCVAVLRRGVRRGIEFGNKIFMPVLFIILMILVVKGLLSSGAADGLRFLFSPDWNDITPTMVVIALGHSFFSLSIGLGTMITYGSYLSDESNIPKSCFPVAMADTLISILAAIAIFTIAFSAGVDVSGGPGLIFHTLPLVFSQIAGGQVVAVLFFLLVALAALTSEISVMEPVIAYLIDEKGFKRRTATLWCALGSFLLGVPSALAYSVLSGVTLFDKNILDCIEFVTTTILLPLCGFCAVILVGWRWGFKEAFKHLSRGAEDLFAKQVWLKRYFWFGIKYSAPVLMVLVVLHAVGLI
jgi:neurotransmitter:Na+ symporter, NSS family